MFRLPRTVEGWVMVGVMVGVTVWGSLHVIKKFVFFMEREVICYRCVEGIGVRKL